MVGLVRMRHADQSRPDQRLEVGPAEERAVRESRLPHQIGLLSGHFAKLDDLPLDVGEVGQ